MGIKVGKVTEIKFDPSMKTPDGEEVKLRIRVNIDKGAWSTIRGDSKFYINLAGVIGEKFIEVSPGSTAAPELVPGTLVRGEDPPRIDQLISQSYGLAGKVLDMIERNEGSVTDTIAQMNNLVNNLNKTLVLLDKTSKNKEFAKIIGNVSMLTEDMTILSSRLRGPEAEKTLDLVHRLMWRLDKLDEKSIREFLQKEGIRARLF
jgi:phospholipid/cholesterol/gamma-HCH transport system substrate-binding protein